MNLAIQSLPIENGFSIKFNPISPKEELTPKKFGALFGKIPQDFKREAVVRRDILTKNFFRKVDDVPSGYTNQVAKLLFPAEYMYDPNNTQTWANVNFLNLPIIRQPYNDYKIIVATAPPYVKLGGDNKQTIIYVVFPEDGFTDPTAYNIPSIYFVNEKNGKMHRVKKGPGDPIMIVDSNRTVTGLKSKEISKYVSFKNKWTNRYNYRITR